MSMEPSGEYGLRHRVRLGLRFVKTYSYLAEYLDVDEAEIRRYLEDPNYVISGDTLTNTLVNIANVNPDEALETTSQFAEHHAYVWYEAPLWDEVLLIALVFPTGTTRFKLHYHAPYADGKIRTSIWYDVYTWAALDGALDATGGDLSLLTAVVAQVES